jgi:gliding motility-associated-like protein
MTMPDHACSGETRHYYVIPGLATGSTFTWWIDGNVMPECNTCEFIYTWNSSKTYLLEVQERSADGCPGPKRSGQVFVNPQPEIEITVSDTLICDGESVTISVQNPSGLIWGKWIYDLIVEPEAGITGNTINSTYTSPTNLIETLFNNSNEIHKVVYRFIPGIVTDEGIRSCEGEEVKITVWIQPGFICQEAFLEIPDAFSPNGDGINDAWNLENIDLYPRAEVTVYNRWGQLVWKSGRGYPVPWGGKSGGDDLPVDSYHYFIELHNGYRPIVGTVTVVR